MTTIASGQFSIGLLDSFRRYPYLERKHTASQETEPGTAKEFGRCTPTESDLSPQMRGYQGLMAETAGNELTSSSRKGNTIHDFG